MKKLSKFVDTRIGFFTLLVILFCLKTLFAYFTAVSYTHLRAHET